MTEPHDELDELVKRATAALNETIEAKSARARNTAENKYYALCETIYWVLRSRALPLT